jgi:hypothetical protein
MPSLTVLSRFLVTSTLLLGLALVPTSVRGQEAQDVSAAASEPPHLALVDGAATLNRDGQTEPAAANAPVVEGDRLSTTNGRVEVLFPDGSTLDLDEFSTADFLAPGLIRLAAGRAFLLVTRDSSTRYQIDTPVASARIDGPGEFRVAALPNRNSSETELAVVRGFATLTTEQGSTSLRAGERSVAVDNSSPSRPEGFNSARFDAFDRWVADRRDARVATTSAQYLPGDLRVYGGTLDRYGSWQYTQPYGYVWYPTVTAGWRPYYNGYWSPVRRYGWTWIGGDVWAWPTHHFGRWGYGRGSWFWIPGRTWAPAWVSWADATDYVSWCPLGFDGRPVFALSIGYGDPWTGWVVVPRRSFGYRGYYANRYAVAPHLIPRSTPFIVRSTAPVPVPRAARTGTVAPGSAGIAVPRTGGQQRGGDRVRGDRGLGRESANTTGGAGSPTVDRRPGSGDSDQRAVRRWGPAEPQPSPREFKQPLPETGRPSTIERANRGEASSTTPAGNPGSRYRTGSPDSGSERAAPPTEAVRRWGPATPGSSQPPGSAPPSTGRAGAPSQSTPNDPTVRAHPPVERSERAAPSYGSEGARRAAPATPPAAQPPSSAPPPSGERAVPRSAPPPAAAHSGEGSRSESHGSSRSEGSHSGNGGGRHR